MTTTASDTVPGADLRARFLPKRSAARLPDFRVAEIVRRFDVNVANARGDVNVSLDKPVGRRDMAIAATGPHAFFVAAMRRFLEIRIVELECHGMTAGAKGIGQLAIMAPATAARNKSATKRQRLIVMAMPLMNESRSSFRAT